MAQVDLAWQPSLLDGPAVEFDPEFRGLCRRELAEGAWVDHAPGWCRGADVLFDRLLHDTPWSGREVRMYDRIVPEPRLTHRWRVDEGPAPPVELCAMARVLGERYGVTFTQVWVNPYDEPCTITGVMLTTAEALPRPGAAFLVRVRANQSAVLVGVRTMNCAAWPFQGRRRDNGELRRRWSRMPETAEAFRARTPPVAAGQGRQTGRRA